MTDLLNSLYQPSGAGKSKKKRKAAGKKKKAAKAKSKTKRKAKAKSEARPRGRPPLAEPKNEQVKAAATLPEKVMFEKLAEKEGMSLSDIIREELFARCKARRIRRPSAAQIEAYEASRPRRASSR